MQAADWGIGRHWAGIHRLSGMPTQVVVPSVSRAAVLHGFVGTTFVVKPSAAGLLKPNREPAGCSAIPWAAAGATGGAEDWPVIGGDDAPVPVPGAGAFPTPVEPPMTPPVVGGFALGEVGAALTAGTDPDADGGEELFVAALFVGAPPPTAPAGAPPPTAPAGAPPPTAFPPVPAAVPDPP
jgi:hypothetical protein